MKLSVLKVKFFVLSTIFNGFWGFTTFAQIGVSFPTNRLVFQRNNENFGFVNILGNYTQSIDKIEAKLTPIIAGQGTATDWSLVQENPKAGYFVGKIKGQGGWYKLEIRAIKKNIVLQTISVEKVGIGEVFIALGQSNAHGISNYGAKGAIDDRVNAINFKNTDVLNSLPENLNFVQLSDNVNVAPQGDGPWCYGELGDRLVRRLNVPVAFFNEGLLLVSVINWRESAEGSPTFNFVLDVGGRFQLPKGLPYVNLKNTLHYYASLMGVRSLLWIQGETDNSPNRLTASVYSANLQRVIDISRNDFDENLTWMVARTSLTYLAPSNPEIIGGQNNIINKAGNNVFAGPFTDNLQVPRFDNVHFQNVPGNMGISLLAEHWDKSLDDNFFQNSKPILAKSIVEPEILCDVNNQVLLKIPEGFKSYEWSNNAKTNQITVGKGTFSVLVKDNKGNKYLVPTINTDFVYPKEKPIISSSQGLEFCNDGIDKVELMANGQEFKSFRWSSGESTTKISVNITSNFTVKGINSLGCISAESDRVSVKANPIPAKPQIIVSPANAVCEGQTITLSIDTNDKILWSNKDTTKTISINKIGNYEFSAIVTNAIGCVSQPSSIQKLIISTIPKQPSIQQVGVFSLQATNGDFITNDQFEWKKENLFFTKTTLPILRNLQTGNYQVSTLRTYKLIDNQELTCRSIISGIIVFHTSNNSIIFYPNPATETIYLETKEVIRNVEVKFYTVLGKQVYQFRLDNTSERREIDVRSLEKGIYIVKINGDGFEESKRLIIQSK